MIIIVAQGDGRSGRMMRLSMAVDDAGTPPAFREGRMAMLGREQTQADDA
jgi:hypothetical protein